MHKTSFHLIVVDQYPTFSTLAVEEFGYLKAATDALLGTDCSQTII